MLIQIRNERFYVSDHFEKYAETRNQSQVHIQIKSDGCSIETLTTQTKINKKLE